MPFVFQRKSRDCHQSSTGQGGCNGSNVTATGGHGDAIILGTKSTQRRQCWLLSYTGQAYCHFTARQNFVSRTKYLVIGQGGLETEKKHKVWSDWNVLTTVGTWPQSIAFCCCCLKETSNLLVCNVPLDRYFLYMHGGKWLLKFYLVSL